MHAATRYFAFSRRSRRLAEHLREIADQDGEEGEGGSNDGSGTAEGPAGAARDPPCLPRLHVRALEENDLLLLLDAARWATSAGNTRVQRFLVLQDPEQIRRAKALAPGVLATPPAIIVICTDLDAAVRAEVRVERDPSVYIDVGTAAMSMMAEAHALGLGTCPATSFSQEGVRTVLGLPHSADRRCSSSSAILGPPPRPPLRGRLAIPAAGSSSSPTGSATATLPRTPGAGGVTGSIGGGRRAMTYAEWQSERRSALTSPTGNLALVGYQPVTGHEPEPIGELPPRYPCLRRAGAC